MRILLMLAALVGFAPADGPKRLAPLPNKDGVASPFAGVSRGALIVAGGANFPGKKPWEGGTKVWHDSIFVLESPDGAWKVGGRLPRPLGYGVSVTRGDSVVCVGGSDRDRHYSDCFTLTWADGEIRRAALPSLPEPSANACGALVGSTFFVAGGQRTPESTEASQSVWALDLASAKPAWREVGPIPGPGRILAVAASHDGSFWVVGGASLKPDPDGKAVRTYLTDAYRYKPGQGWSKIASVPTPVTAAPSPAADDSTGFSILGGDDGAQVGAAPDRHRGFSPRILRYESKSDTWSVAGTIEAPRVTVPLVRWDSRRIVPSGEARPGIRSPEVWSFPTR